MRGSGQRSAVSRQRGWAVALALAALWGSAGAYTVQHGRLTVSYADARDRGQLGAVFRAFDAAAADLGALGLKVPDRVEVVAALSAADFARRTGEPANIAASTVGAVIRTQRLSALAARGLLPLTIRHELFHVVQPKGLERWKAEGLARIFSGEAGQDGPGPTGFESLSDAELNRALLGRNPAQLTAAYHEASKRAARLLAKQGWAKVLNSP